VTDVLQLSSSLAGFVARAVRVCNYFELMGTPGHCSVRDDGDPNVIWINNRHASRSTVTAADIVPYDLTAGARVGEGIEPPSEHWIHREIYLRSPDVRGVVHSHPNNIVTLSCSGIAVQPLISIASFLPEAGVPVLDTPVLINTEARGRAMVEALGDAPAVTLRQHGAVTRGGSLEEAVVRMYCLEHNARLQLAALQVGAPRYFAGSEKTVLAGESGTPHGVKKLWTYLEETAAHAGALRGLD
jgi:ribulose-5-phosphate 4-epimerase/fuculose-1-phosphate aldolase